MITYRLRIDDPAVKDCPMFGDCRDQVIQAWITMVDYMLFAQTTAPCRTCPRRVSTALPVYGGSH